MNGNRFKLSPIDLIRHRVDGQSRGNCGSVTSTDLHQTYRMPCGLQVGENPCGWFVRYRRHHENGGTPAESSAVCSEKATDGSSFKGPYVSHRLQDSG